jgi:hypothetical protein
MCDYLQSINRMDYASLIHPARSMRSHWQQINKIQKNRPSICYSCDRPFSRRAEIATLFRQSEMDERIELILVRSMLDENAGH